MFRNAYGELPATQIAKLPFYGGLTIAYGVIGMSVSALKIRELVSDMCRFWGFLYVQNRHDIRQSSFVMIAVVKLELTKYSARSKLHNRHSHFPHCRAIHDLGLLRYIVLSAEDYGFTYF